MGKPTLTAERVRQVLHYAPETGVFTLRSSGEVAGCNDHDGYRRLTLDGQKFYEHRLAWFYMTGGWPQHQIDHKDTDPSNNRWSNLRPATHTQNVQNVRRARVCSTTGLLGVQRHRDRYSALIRVNGKRLYLGTFDTPEEAHQSYVRAKRRLHPLATL